MSAFHAEHGSLMLFSHYESGGEMWTGQGPREVRHPVEFEQPFAAPPIVHVSAGLLDIQSSANIRTDIGSTSVTETGFTVLFRTWGDTRVARVRADWLAVGTTRDPEIWDVD